MWTWSSSSHRSQFKSVFRSTWFDNNLSTLGLSSPFFGSLTHKLFPYFQFLHNPINYIFDVPHSSFFQSHGFRRFSRSEPTFMIDLIFASHNVLNIIGRRPVGFIAFEFIPSDYFPFPLFQNIAIGDYDKQITSCADW